MKRLAAPAVGLAIFLLNVWLNAPLFMSGELPFRGSIEMGYVGMARFISQHPNPWGWNPLPYCGLPLQFMYVPAVLYFSALWMNILPHFPPDTVYRFIVAIATCLGPVTLFAFALHFTRSLRWAAAAAIIYSIVSPSYGLFPAVEKDRGIVQLPWRIQVLAKYGEGPHNTGLTLLPLALLALWRAARSRRYPPIFVAAVALAAIPLVNWLAGFSLAISCVLLLLAAFGEQEFQYRRAFAAAGLAYLLACFWLTPSFVKTIANNWPVDSFAYHLGREQVYLIAGMTAGALLIRILFRVLRGSFYFCLVTMGAFVFGWIATAFYIYGLDTIPESRRYAIEFELFLMLAIVEAVRLSMRNSNGTVRLCAAGSAAVMLLVGTPQIWAYLTQGWQAWRPVPPQTTVEYNLAQWIAQHPPEGRVFASGGLRFRLNAWLDVPQVGGGFETGLQNRVPVDLAYKIRAGSDATLLQLKAVGAQYVVIHGPNSREYYRDFIRPERVAAALPAVYHIEDDTIYALPARPLAHLVTADELPDIARYVAAIEDPARPTLQVRWTDSSTMRIIGFIRAAQLVSVQINADPGWRAQQDGHPIAADKDDRGFIVLHPDPSPVAQIELHYEGTAEQRIGATVSVLSWIVALAALAYSGVAARRGQAYDQTGGDAALSNRY